MTLSKILSRCDVVEGCWHWRGALNPKGYARIYVGVRSGKRRYRSGGQVVWEIDNGKSWPDGKLACHTCDTPACVNPKHVWPGTAKENSEDAIRKGRGPWMHKTHCPKGHELAGDNLYMNGNWRACRKCRLDGNRDRKRAKREAART